MIGELLFFDAYCLVFWSGCRRRSFSRQIDHGEYIQVSQPEGVKFHNKSPNAAQKFSSVQNTLGAVPLCWTDSPLQNEKKTYLFYPSPPPLTIPAFRASNFSWKNKLPSSFLLLLYRHTFSFPRQIIMEKKNLHYRYIF